MDRRSRRFQLRMYGLWAVLMLVAAVALSGCGTTGEQYAGVNYGEVTTSDGEHWIVAGGKNGNGVSLEITATPEGGRTVKWTAENYDASTMFAQAMDAQNERYDRIVNLLLTLVGPKP